MRSRFPFHSPIDVMPAIWLNGCMKTTLNIPDDLYREVKAKSALEGRAVREVTVELYTAWLGRKEKPSASAASTEWLEDWVRMGTTARSGRRSGQTATDALLKDRGRLDRR